VTRTAAPARGATWQDPYVPKVNVYLPDALADRVREARLPVSRICQAALTQALEAGGAAVESTAALALPEPLQLTPPPNHHVAAILRQSYDAAAARGSATVETVDLLQAFLDEGESLVLNTVELLGVPAAAIQSGIDAAVGRRPAPRGRPRQRQGGQDPRRAAPSLSAGAHAALAVAAAQAAAHGSAATTGSHLLLGLLRDTGTAGEVLRAAGVAEVATPAVLSALYYGVSFGRLRLDRDTDAAWLRTMLHDVVDRLDRIEHRLGTHRD